MCVRGGRCRGARFMANQPPYVDNGGRIGLPEVNRVVGVAGPGGPVEQQRACAGECDARTQSRERVSLRAASEK